MTGADGGGGGPAADTEPPLLPPGLLPTLLPTEPPLLPHGAVDVLLELGEDDGKLQPPPPVELEVADGADALADGCGAPCGGCARGGLPGA